MQQKGLHQTNRRWGLIIAHHLCTNLADTWGHGITRGVAVEPPLQEDIDVQRRYQSLVKHFLSSPFCKASTVLVVIKMKTRVRRASRKPGPRRGPNPGDTAHDYIYIYLIYISLYFHSICASDSFSGWVFLGAKTSTKRNQRLVRSYGEKSPWALES